MKQHLPLGQPGQTHSLLRRQIPPLPNPYTAPGTEHRFISPGSQERSSDLHLTCTAPTDCPIRAQSSWHLPPPSLLPTESPLLCPPHMPCSPWAQPTPVLPWHGFSFIAHSAKSQPHPWKGLGAEKQEGSPAPSVCLTPPCRQCPEPVPPRVPAGWQEISAGCRCLSALAAGEPGWKKVSQAGRDCREGSQAQLSPSSEPTPCATAQSSSGPTWSLQKPWSPVLQLWQEIEDSSDEFFKFILMDYVACTFNVLDFCLGEEALDLWVVSGAAGQGNMP